MFFYPPSPDPLHGPFAVRLGKHKAHYFTQGQCCLPQHGQRGELPFAFAPQSSEKNLSYTGRFLLQVPFTVI